MGQPWDYVDLDGWPVGDKCMTPHPTEPEVYCRKQEDHGSRCAPAMSDFMRRHGDRIPDHPGPPAGVVPGPLHPVFEEQERDN